MDENFKFDIFTKGRIADIPVVIQKAHTRLYDQQKNFKYKISSECQVIATSTKIMIDLCSRMKSCMDALSDIKDVMIEFSNYQLQLDTKNESCADTDILYDIRWVQNLSFRSYKLIKDKKFVQCFKLIFIDAINKFSNIQSSNNYNDELARELDSYNDVFFNILIPNLHNKLVSHLESTQCSLDDAMQVLIILIAIEVYTGGDVKSVKNLFTNYRNILIDNSTDPHELINVLHASYLGLELFNLKISTSSFVDKFKCFSQNKNINLGVKYIATNPIWSEIVSQKISVILNKSSNFNNVKLIYQKIHEIESDDHCKLIDLIKQTIAEVGLEIDSKFEFSDLNRIKSQLMTINDMLTLEVPKIISKWLCESFTDNSSIDKCLNDFSATLETISECLDNIKSVNHFKSELVKILNKVDQNITNSLSKIKDITFERINEVLSMKFISNLKKLDILATSYLIDKREGGSFVKYLNDKVVALAKKYAESIDKMIKINNLPNYNNGKGVSINVLLELSVRSRFISLYMWDSECEGDANNYQFLIVKTIIAYGAFKAPKISSLQEAIDSEFMLLKYNEFTSDDCTMNIMEKLCLEGVNFDTYHTFNESKQIAIEADSNTRYMFPGIAMPHS